CCFRLLLRAGSRRRVAPRQRKITFQLCRPVTLPLQRFAHIRRARGRRLEFFRLSRRLGHQRRLCLHVAPRRREVLCQPACAVALLLQRFSQVRGARVICLLQLACFGCSLGHQRRLCLDIAPRCRKVLLQPARVLVFLLQRLFQIHRSTFRCLLEVCRL